ncbi:helix-turn-helix transcriptional regulator [uncultured Bifidobacterium sp.]|uniref:helix-turn-helix domain-containing protein n=1 Tax=uncultured Bifidobacterium sp. TaxID=165187 RepID=UPI002582801F|nr:helix-turn-helix transcriptional regulator [uncultured Bifidobacterium sp.]
MTVNKPSSAVTSRLDDALVDARLTEELLNRLLRSTDIGSFLDSEHIVDLEFTDYLRSVLEHHGLTRADVVRASGLNPTVVYDIFAGKSRPGRDSAIMLSLGLDCDLQETQRLLRLAGVSELWCKQRRDAIIIWCVNNGYDRDAVDHELIRFNEKPLLSKSTS